MKVAPGLDALKGASQRVLTRVDVHSADGTVVVSDLPVAGGSVRGSSLRINRWEGNLEVAGLEHAPTSAADYLSGLSAHYVSVHVGRQAAGDAPVWVHLANLWPVDSTVTVSKEQGTFSLDLASAGYLAEQAGGLVHTPLPGETAQQFAARILTEQLPYTPTVTDTSTPFDVPASYEPDESPVFLVVEEMMSLASARLYFDAYGDIIIRPALGGIDVEPPVKEGSYAVDVTQHDVRVGRSNFYNDVVVRFRGTDQQIDETVGRAWLTAGDLRRDGPAGRSTFTVTLDVTATQSQATAYAKRVLQAQMHTWTSVQIQATPDPRVEPGDTIQMTYLDGRVLLQRVVGVQHDLGTAPMALTARTAIPEDPALRGLGSDASIHAEAAVEARRNNNIWVPTLKGTSVEGDSANFAQGNIGIGQAESLEVDGKVQATSIDINTPEGEERANLKLGNDYVVQRLIATDGKRYLWLAPVGDLIGAGSYTIGPTSGSETDAKLRLRVESLSLEHQGFSSDFNSEWQAMGVTGGFTDYGGSYALRFRVAGNVLYIDGLMKGWSLGTTFTTINYTGIGDRFPYHMLLNAQHSNSGMVRLDVNRVSKDSIKIALTSSSGGVVGNNGLTGGFINMHQVIPLAKGFGYPPSGGSGGSGGGSLTTQTQTFPATWWRSFRGDNTPRTGTHSHIYQGRVESYQGRQRALVGYNVTGIPATHVPISGYMTIDWEHWYYSSGGTAYFFPAAHASAPSTFSVQSNTSWTHTFSTANPGPINIPLPANIVAQLLSGYTKSIALGPPPSDSLSYYGYAKPTPSITLRYQA